MVATANPEVDRNHSHGLTWSSRESREYSPLIARGDVDRLDAVRSDPRISANGNISTQAKNSIRQVSPTISSSHPVQPSGRCRFLDGALGEFGEFLYSYNE
jgi:hypothetical protein